MRGLLVVEAPSTGSGRTDLGGARAVGSGGCDGGRRRPAPRPCPGFPRERERRWGVWWDALARGVRVRVGARSRGRAVREPPLRPGRAHEGAVCAGGAPSCALRANERFGKPRAVGSGGHGDGGPRPRPCPGFPRERERRWGVWWDALARGVGVRVGGPLSRAGGSRTAPTTGVGRTRAGVMRGLLVVEGALRQAQGERVWEGRVRGEWGMRWGTGGRRPAPRTCPIARSGNGGAEGGSAALPAGEGFSG